MDIILVGLIAGLTFGGWRTGFIYRVFGLLFMAIAFVLGAYLRGPLGDLAAGLLKDVPRDYAALIGYSLAFPVVLAVLHIVANPFLKRIQLRGMTLQLDRALGAVFGFIEAVLILSAVVVILDTYFAGGETTGNRPGFPQIEALAAQFNATTTVHLLRETTVPVVLTVLGPLLPKDISSLVPGGAPGLPGMPGFPY